MLTVIKPARRLRAHFFKTKEREVTREIIVDYARTPPDPRIDAAFVDQMNASRGHLSIVAHYLIRMNGLVEIGRDPKTISTARKTFTEAIIVIHLVGGLDDQGSGAPTETPAQRQAVEDLMQLLANTLSCELEVEDKVQEIAEWHARREERRRQNDLREKLEMTPEEEVDDDDDTDTTEGPSYAIQ